MIKEIKAINSTFCAGIISLVLCATAEAALIKGEFEVIGEIFPIPLIYDTDLDITWLGFGNHAAESIYDDGHSATDGRMTWASANNWAADLSYLGFTSWRLPTAVAIQDDPSCQSIQYPGDGNFYNYNCRSSEMGHLFYDELGGIVDIADNSSIFDETFFDGLLHNNYWSSTLAEVGCHPGKPLITCAWDYDFKNSVTEDYRVNLNFHALAVHDGDIGMLGAVPIPPAVWLFCCGLIGLMCVARQNAR